MIITDNGGAHAIKGFNYQKSVVVLISVLHYLSDKNFEIYVESKDDIVIELDGTQTFIQVKGKKLSISELTKQVSSKDSLLKRIYQRVMMKVFTKSSHLVFPILRSI